MRYKLNVVRYMIAIMLVWGGMQISYGQDNVSKDCPPSSSTESKSLDQEQNMSEMEMSTDSLIQSRGNKEYIEIPAEGEFEYEYKGEKGKLDYKFEKEQGNDDAAKIELKDNEDQSNFSKGEQKDVDVNADTTADVDTNMDMELEQEDQSKGCPDTSGIGTSSEIDNSSVDTNGNANIYVDNDYETTVYAEPAKEKEHSTLGTIVRAPVKFVGNIPKAAVSVVSETLEGAGHIVGAPFKGIAKLFGSNEPKDKYNHEHDNM
jgi:hypothetical protein